MMILLCTILAGFVLGALLHRSPLSLYLKRNPAPFVLLGCLLLVMLTTACGVLGAISALLPAIGQVATNILAFVLALKGGTVSPEVVAKIQGWVAKITDAIAVVQKIIADEKANPTASTFAKIQLVLNDMLQSLDGLLADANITNSTVVRTIEGLAALGVAAVNSILAIVSQASSISMRLASHTISTEEVKLADDHAADKLKAEHDHLKLGFKLLVSSPTGDSDVDAALATLKHLP
jgi:hypothetical protein